MFRDKVRVNVLGNPSVSGQHPHVEFQNPIGIQTLDETESLMVIQNAFLLAAAF